MRWKSAVHAALRPLEGKGNAFGRRVVFFCWAELGSVVQSCPWHWISQNANSPNDNKRGAVTSSTELVAVIVGVMLTSHMLLAVSTFTGQIPVI